MICKSVACFAPIPYKRHFIEWMEATWRVSNQIQRHVFGLTALYITFVNDNINFRHKGSLCAIQIHNRARISHIYQIQSRPVWHIFFIQETHSNKERPRYFCDIWYIAKLWMNCKIYFTWYMSHWHFLKLISEYVLFGLFKFFGWWPICMMRERK